MSEDLFAYADAKRRRNAGLAQVESHGARFAHAAYSAIEIAAQYQPTVHIDDVLRHGVTDDNRNLPHHPNAWGAVWMRAIRNGLIARTDETRPCTLDPKKHAHRYPVYRSLTFKGAPA